MYNNIIPLCPLPPLILKKCIPDEKHIELSDSDTIFRNEL